ncbi:MAG: ATP-dependent DNA helicase RecQ [Thermomicrobiales bacterium]
MPHDIPLPANLAHQVRRVARDRLGLDELRPGQEEAIIAVLEGSDTLAVLPTGFGKSAIYQIAGALLPGATLVVSPLIALQRDQVEAISNQDIGDAALVNSTLRSTERKDALAEVAGGEREFLFLAPEQLANEETLAQLRDIAPSLLVVDEAHCVSEWGHDFRPEYLRLGAVAATLGQPRILALTATASPPVREEIAARLGMRDPRVIVHGFDRPNIHLAVEGFADGEEKTDALLDRVVVAAKPGIVYAATRGRTEAIAAALVDRGIGAAAYHAGMSAGAREQAQDGFMNDEIEVIVATTAFGMGIDKPNVRFVFHHDVSESVDAYYQEIGRAGRDGEPASAILFFRLEDLNLRRFFAGSGNVDPEDLERIAELVSSAGGPIDAATIQETVDLSQTRTMAAIQRLEDIGAVEVRPSGEVIAANEIDPGQAAALAMTEQEQRRKFTRSRLEMMRGYADMRGCRRQYILNYFGETFEPPCGDCDRCDAGLPDEDGALDQLPFPLGAAVVHDAWGDGVIMRYAGESMVVLFDSVGYRTLSIPIVLEKGLLSPAGATPPL